MPLGDALNNVFSLDRQRARYESERVSSNEEDQAALASAAENSDAAAQDAEAGVTSAPSTNNNNSEDGPILAPATRSSGRRDEAPGVESSDEDDGASESLVGEAFEPDGESDDQLFASRSRSRNTMSLAELEEQRELSRRRSSACVLLAVFVLFRLWVECLQKKDPTLLLLCLLGTSWTARWIRYNREREEELDRRIENYLQNNNNNAREEGVDRNEYARLSFQAQLALAIMESQRHMMEGGYGRPDGEEEQSPGVSEAAKGRWKKFSWKGSGDGLNKGGKGDYGALPNKGAVVPDMDNHCSICLSEYEDKETLTQLPCGHVYHNECIDSWTANHTKCPLCNMELEVEGSSNSGEGESIV